MKWMILCLCLSGCASLPPETYRSETEQKAAEITAKFNQLAGTDYAVPDIRWMDTPCEAGQVTGDANARFRVLWISTDCAKRFPVETMQDILPHELAHIFVQRFYGADEDHNAIWQTAALKLGMSCYDNDLSQEVKKVYCKIP